jgi:hypothetical protein
MKIRAITAITCLLITLAIVESRGQSFLGGLHGGLVTSQVSGDMLGGFNKPGIYGGAFVNFRLKPEHSLQLELSFIQKGSRKSPNFEVGDFTSYLLNMNYVEIPVYYRYEPFRRLGLEAALSYAYLLSVSEEDHNGEIPRPVGGPQFKNYDVSAGAGLYTYLSPTWIMRMRVSHSVLPVRSHASGAAYRLNYGQYHHVLMFSMCYQFRRSE